MHGGQDHQVPLAAINPLLNLTRCPSTRVVSRAHAWGSTDQLLQKCWDTREQTFFRELISSRRVWPISQPGTRGLMANRSLIPKKLELQDPRAHTKRMHTNSQLQRSTGTCNYRVLRGGMSRITMRIKHHNIGYSRQLGQMALRPSKLYTPVCRLQQGQPRDMSMGPNRSTKTAYHYTWNTPIPCLLLRNGAFAKLAVRRKIPWSLNHRISFHRGPH